MKLPKLVHAMTYIDDQLIANAESAVHPQKCLLRWSSVAACLILLLGTVTAVAATGLGTRLLEMFTSRSAPGSDLTESGYTLQADIQKVPTSALSEDVNGVSQIIRQQFSSYSPYSSQSPSSWRKDFPSLSEAVLYIGLDSLRIPDLGLDEQSTSLTVIGSADGSLQTLGLETVYQVGRLRVQAYCHIYTEHYTGAVTYGTATTEDVTFQEALYATDGGLKYRVLTSTSLASGYESSDGILVRDGILYTLHIAHLEQDQAQAEALLHHWAELFDD